MSTCNAFPTPSEEGELIKSAWNRANEETSQDVPIALTPVITKVVSAMLYNTRGRLRRLSLAWFRV